MQSGSEQFNDWIARRFPGQAPTNDEVAAVVGMDRSLVTKLRKGTRGVGLAFAHHLERHCGIPTEAWLSDDADETESLVVANRRNSKKDKASTANARR